MPFVHNRSGKMPSCRRSPLPLIQFDEAVKKAGRIRQEITFMARSVLSETPNPNQFSPMALREEGFGILPLYRAMPVSGLDTFTVDIFYLWHRITSPRICTRIRECVCFKY